MPIDPRRPFAATPSLASTLLRVAMLVPWLPSGLMAQDPAARLDEVVTGAVEETFDQRLQQVAWILARADTMAPVVAEKIRGDQQEYLLRIEKLLTQLTDERWLAREEAERSLSEIGGRARVRIEQRQRSAPLLEERQRCERILRALDARGMAREETELRRLNTLIQAAGLMPRDARLGAALAVAAQHTDIRVAVHALAALGRQATEAELPVLEAATGSRDARRRRSAVLALAQSPQDLALTTLAKIAAAGTLPRDECIAAMALAQRRPDGAALLGLWRRHPDPLVAMAAVLPPLVESPVNQAPRVALRLPEGDEVQGRLLGLALDLVRLQPEVEPGEGGALPPMDLRVEGATLALDPEAQSVPAEGWRFFFRDGSVVLGHLVQFDQERLTVAAGALGTLSAARERLAGVAFDPTLERLPFASERSDRWVTKDGRATPGSLVRLDPEQISLRLPDGSLSTRSQAELSAIVLHRQVAPPDSETFTAVTQSNGGRLIGHVAQSSPARWTMVHPIFGVVYLETAHIARVDVGIPSGSMGETTIVADYGANRILEFDAKGQEIFAIAEVLGPRDVECLDNGNLLITEDSGSRVIEMTRAGEIVWSFSSGLRNPTDADALQNGNVLIADTYGDRVIEVDRAGKIVWQYAGGIRPFDADRLPNGNTLIADFFKERVIEVDPEGRIVWEVRGMANVIDADRLPDGNTLICMRASNRVVEVDVNGRVVWEIGGLDSPSDADRLPNGNTLIAEHGAVREIDRNGRTIWRVAVNWAVEANRY